AARRQNEPRVETDLGEARDAVDAIEHAFGVAVETEPRQLRSPRDRTKGEYQAVHRRRDEQRLGRPLITGAAELRRRRRQQARQALRCKRHAAFGLRGGLDSVVMRIRVHTEPLGFDASNVARQGAKPNPGKYLSERANAPESLRV